MHQQEPTNTTDKYPVAELVDKQKKQKIARIQLNGHQIKSGGPLGFSGLMRSFHFLDGNLDEMRYYWRLSAPLNLLLMGRLFQVRVAAIPPDKTQVGFIEFMPQ